MNQRFQPAFHVVVLTVLLGAIGCASSTTMSSTDGRFEARLPPRWKQADCSESRASIAAVNPDSHAYCRVFEASTYGGALGGHWGPLKLDDYRDECLAYSAKQSKLKNRIVEAPESITLNGKPAVRFRVTGFFDGVDCEFFSTIFESGRNGVLVRCWCKQSEFERNKADFETIACSVVDHKP